MMCPCRPLLLVGDVHTDLAYAGWHREALRASHQVLDLEKLHEHQYALDRQHPRDPFDVWQLYESGGVTDGWSSASWSMVIVGTKAR
jgi:hypothetical protein